MAYKNKTCIECNQSFIPTSGHQKRCPLCSNTPKYKTAKCVICGKNFFRRDKQKITCSPTCRKEYRNYSENSVIDNVYMSEEERLNPPSEEYIKEIKILLLDFGINEEMPDFDSVKKLNEWKNKLIKQALSD